MRSVGKSCLFGIMAGVALFLPLGAVHADPPVYQLTISSHRFEPPMLQVPANTKLRLHVRNLDPTAEEFESSDLQREKVIPGKGAIETWIGPLDPGTYKFYGDFNPASAQGQIIAK